MDLTPQKIFGPQGVLSRNLPYFEYRPSQIDYAIAVRKTLAAKKIAMLEAQTGTGKTLGYMIPALETRRRIILSTGTKALQEQLIYKDIPLLQKGLGLEFEYLQMKGRANYLCLLKFERVQSEPMLPDAESVEYFADIQKWAAETEAGDIAESGIPESAVVWRELTISSEACHGSKCRFYSQCFITRMKQKAEKAQLIVVNHHLFFADLSLQVLSGTSILPSYDIVIFDEAHQLPEVATHNMSIAFSETGFRELQEDLLRELKILQVREKLRVQPAQKQAQKLAQSIASLFMKFTGQPQRLRYDRAGIRAIVEDHGQVIDSMFVSLLEMLNSFVDKSEDMPQIHRRTAMHQTSLALLLNASDEGYVYWAERRESGDWSLHASPLDVSGLLKESLWPNLSSAILTSATLFVDQNCSGLKEDLGLDESVDQTFPYNFDYESQACLYVPRNIPEPTDPRFPQAAAGEILNLVKVTDGGAFVLCTSYSNMRVYQTALQDLDYPLLIQGTRSKQALLKSFLKRKHSVLLATMSFWQGIDVQGESLVSVIVDKLPFAAPNDPLMEARITYLKKKGQNPFLDYQLPMAVMMLRQGLGRLIRTSVDYGLLAVLDRRLLTKNYGQVFLRNLPKMPILSRFGDLKKAFEGIQERFGADR